METQADRIRRYVYDHYVSTAKKIAAPVFVVRAGDVHREMRLNAAMPAVCSAIGSKKFEEMANVSLRHRKGPNNGANVYFSFDICGAAEPTTGVTFRGASLKREAVAVKARSHLNLEDALVLVSCVKSKSPAAAPARLLYVSPWFTKVREIVEANEAPWYVLSSYYGLVAPNARISPYDFTLNTCGTNERRRWAAKVLDQLRPVIAGKRRVVMFAGRRYYEFLIEPLQRMGIAVDLPMEHLSRGEQLGWLSKSSE